MVHSTSLIPFKLFLSITFSNASGAQPHGFNYYNMCAQSLQSCPTLCNPTDCSPPGSSVHGDPPGKKIEVGCHFFSRRSSRPRNGTSLSYVSGTGRPLVPPGTLPDYYNSLQSDVFPLISLFSTISQQG